MEDIVSSSKENLVGVLQNIDIGVARERKNRSNFEIERWILFRFLATELENENFQYPVVIRKLESPDFLIIQKNIKTGIEVTEAINPNYLKAVSLPEAKTNKNSVDVGYFKWKKSHDLVKLRDIASRTKLTSAPWKGNSVEVEFSEIVYDVSIKKTKILNKTGYKKYEINSLLIYVNQTLPILDIDEGAEIGFIKLINYWVRPMLTFDKIYVEINDFIICFCKNGYKILDINDLWEK